MTEPTALQVVAWLKKHGWKDEAQAIEATFPDGGNPNSTEGVETENIVEITTGLWTIRAWMTWDEGDPTEMSDKDQLIRAVNHLATLTMEELVTPRQVARGIIRHMDKRLAAIEVKYTASKMGVVIYTKWP